MQQECDRGLVCTYGCFASPREYADWESLKKRGHTNDSERQIIQVLPSQDTVPLDPFDD